MAVVAIVPIAFVVSPWPSILLIRAVFDRGAAEASQRLEPYLPVGIASSTHQYDPADPRAVLDIHRPANLSPGAPTVVWVHGGGFVSGRRSDTTNYSKILAAQGFIVVNVDYTIAPGARYPGPIRQVNRVLSFITREGDKLGVNSARIVLAGDSAGAQIAAQTAAVVTAPAYAKLVGIRPEVGPEQIAGTLLYCGVYDISKMDQVGGILGWFVRSALWAYSGKRDWRDDLQFQTMSIAPHLTSAYPPAFVSAGNVDPLEPQSVTMARAIDKAGAPVETLFFPADYKPPRGHEYQFDLRREAGRLALQKSAAWLRQLPR